MRPAEFTNEQIIEAGHELKDAGRNITGFALRQKVGGGNPARLKQIWDEYINSQAVAKVEPVAELPIEVAEEMAAVSKALTDRLAALAVELNDKAVKAAERRVAEVIRTAGEQREQAERELADASQTVDDLESKLDEVTAANESLEQRLNETLSAHQAQAVELAQLRERLALIEQAAKSADEEHAAELIRLNASMDAERNRLENTARKEAAEHAAELARLNTSIEGERSSYQQHDQQMRADLAELKKVVQELTTDRDQARAELATVKAKADAAEQAHGDEVHRLAERMNRAEAERDAERKETNSARESAAKLLGQVDALQMQVADLMRALASQHGAEAQTPEAKGSAKSTKPKAEK